MHGHRSAGAGQRIVLTTIILVVLTACGQRGPLVLPDAPAASTPAPAPADQTDGQTDDDEDASER